MEKTKKIKYEFAIYDRPQTIVVEKPASIKFINIGTLPGCIAIINRVVTLGRIAEVINGTGIFPGELELTNNSDEVDTTQYTLEFPANEAVLLVIIKHYLPG